MPYISNKFFSVSIKILKRMKKNKNFKNQFTVEGYDVELKNYKPVVRGRERSSTITWRLTKIPLKIHNGMAYRKYRLHYLQVGLKLGSLTINRRPYHFPLKRKKKR